MITDHPIPTLVEEPAEMNDAAYKAELIAVLEKAEASIDRGEFITLEALEKEYYSWTFK